MERIPPNRTTKKNPPAFSPAPRAKSQAMEVERRAKVRTILMPANLKSLYDMRVSNGKYTFTIKANASDTIDSLLKPFKYMGEPLFESPPTILDIKRRVVSIIDLMPKKHLIDLSLEQDGDINENMVWFKLSFDISHKLTKATSDLKTYRP